MPKPRSPNRDIAKTMYIEAKGNIKLKDIAEKLGVIDTQIRKWKSTDNWDAEIKGTLPKPKGTKQTKGKGNVTKDKVQNNNQENQKKILLDEDSQLTEKQKLFCMYYIRNFNATQAYLKAYGGTTNTAGVEGYRLLRKPKVKAEIDSMKKLKLESLMLTEDDILERYIEIAFADMTDFVEFGVEDVPILTFRNDETGEKEVYTQPANTIWFKEHNKVDGGLICEISTSKQGAKIKLEDRQKALDWLANYFEMNPEHKHKVRHDEIKLQLERDRFEHTKQMDIKKEW